MGVPPTGATILVVEDEPDISFLLRLWLENFGYKVIEAGTGERALALAAEARPDLIVLDIRLPGIDGWAVLECLREDDTLREIPVVIASAHASPATLRRAADMGCGYVSKPFSPESVLRAVERRLIGLSSHL